MLTLTCPVPWLSPASFPPPHSLPAPPQPCAERLVGRELQRQGRLAGRQLWQYRRQCGVCRPVRRRRAGGCGGCAVMCWAGYDCLLAPTERAPAMNRHGPPPHQPPAAALPCSEPLPGRLPGCRRPGAVDEDRRRAPPAHHQRGRRLGEGGMQSCAGAVLTSAVAGQCTAP